MTAKVTRKALYTSDRVTERKQFREIVRRETTARGMVLHSKGISGMGKTTLLKMFEEECKSNDLPVPTVTLFFTSKISPVNWQKIIDDTVDKLGAQYFPEYTQLRRVDIAGSNDVENSKATVIYQTNNIQTNIQSVQGSVHTGSGDIKTTTQSTEFTRQSPSAHLESPIRSPLDFRSSLTQAFLKELRKLPDSLQVVWLVDTTERLDETTRAWLIEIFAKIAEEQVEHLVLVASGRDLLCYEPYWIDKIVELNVGNFSRDTISEIIQKIWNIEHRSLIQMVTDFLVKDYAANTQDLITHIESYNPYGD